jgi:hypothetical protein
MNGGGAGVDGGTGIGTPTFVRYVCQNRVQITYFERGNPFENRK